VRAVSRGGYDGTDHADCRCGHHLRHGRSQPAANVAVHAVVLQADGRPTSGRDAAQSQELTHHKSAICVQHGIRSVQTFSAGKAEEQGE